MQPKSPETRTYSFHFNRPTTNLTPNNINSSKEIMSVPKTPKNLSINFRYQCESQQVQSNSFLANQGFKSVLDRKKSAQQMKKYTFSLLLHQNSQPKSNLNSQQQNDNKNNGASSPQKCKDSNLYNYSLRLPTMPNVNIAIPEQTYSLELVKQRENKKMLEKELNIQALQNTKLKEKIKELQSQLLVKNTQIEQLRNQFEDLKRVNKENESIILQNSSKSKSKDSVISSVQMQDNQQSFEKQVKEWSNSTIIYNYEEEYKQILTIFQVQLNQENYHEHLLAQIDKLLKKAEQANRSLAISKEKQRQNYRLTHYIKKVQAQNINMGNLIAFLNKQVAKNSILLQQANKQIEICNIQSLNTKYSIQLIQQLQ